MRTSLLPPVLILTYNRPMELSRVLEAVRESGVKRVFIWSDAVNPMRPEDSGLVAESRRVATDAQEWTDEFQVLFADEHHGLRRGVTRAISWFFSFCEAGVILEDDCLPGKDFFTFCDCLLERFKDDQRVWAISGDNSANLIPEGDASYSFVRYPLVWGWATWRNRWNRFDFDLDLWNRVRNDGAWLRSIWPDKKERYMWRSTLEGIRKRNSPDSWATIWSFTMQAGGGLSIVPRINLISNIGFGPNATHTRGHRHHRSAVETGALGSLVHRRPSRDEDLERQMLSGAVFTVYAPWKARMLGIYRSFGLLLGRFSKKKDF